MTEQLSLFTIEFTMFNYYIFSFPNVLLVVFQIFLVIFFS